MSNKRTQKRQLQRKMILKCSKKKSGSFPALAGSKGVTEDKWHKHELSFHPHFSWERFTSLWDKTSERGSEFSSYKIELCKMVSHFELLTGKVL